jgi:hypothetical protein
LRTLQQQHKLAVDLVTFVEATFQFRLRADELWLAILTLVMLMRPCMNQKTQTGVWFAVFESANGGDSAALHNMAAQFQVGTFLAC